MKTKDTLTIVAAVAAAMFTQASFAQASAPPSRAAVKAETRAAEKAGELVPAGQAVSMPSTEPKKTSDKTRAERKAATREARKEGELVPAGERGLVSPAVNAGPSKSRSEVKSKTRAAEKAGDLVPAGETGLAPQDPAGPDTHKRP